MAENDTAQGLRAEISDARFARTTFRIMGGVAAAGAAVHSIYRLAQGEFDLNDAIVDAAMISALITLAPAIKEANRRIEISQAALSTIEGWSQYGTTEG